MMTVTLLTLSLLLSFIISSVPVSSSSFNLLISNVTCATHSDSVKVFECEVTKLGHNYYAYNGQLIFSKMMQSNFSLRYFVDMAPFPRKNFLRFIDIKLSVCNVVRKGFDIPMVQQVMLEIRRTSNLPFKCPFKPNVPYAFKNLTFSDRFMNKFLPYLNFVQVLNLYESDDVIASLTTRGSILPITSHKNVK